MGAGEVAEALGISVGDAMQALRELRSLGYAREDRRRYAPTEAGTRLHESLRAARREAMSTFFSTIGDEDRRDLIAALRA